MQQVAKMDDMQKIDHLTKRSSELLADMRRLEKENQKNKKRGDSLQKERDSGRTELGKTAGLKEKLEKLCRELQRDNNKMKVRKRSASISIQSEREYSVLTWDVLPCRMRTRSCRPCRSETRLLGTKSMRHCYQN